MIDWILGAFAVVAVLAIVAFVWLMLTPDNLKQTADVGIDDS